MAPAPPSLPVNFAQRVRVSVLVWLLLAGRGAAEAQPVDRADAELCPIYDAIVAIAENGRYTHALRVLDPMTVRYPRDARLPALRARVVDHLAHLKDAPASLPPTRVRLPPIALRQPTAGLDFTTTTADIALCWLAPGSFCLVNPQGSDDATAVTLTRGFWLGRTEVTQTQWRAVMVNLPNPSYFDGSDRPVENVSWANAMEFCQKLTARERALGLLPAGYAYTLPTEAQWEYACRAGTSGAASGAPLADVAWFADNAGRQTHPVGQQAPNAWGFYDLQGNVAEWCADGHNGYPGGAVSDYFNGERGEAGAMYKVIRGGSFASSAGGCRPGFRNRGLLTYASPGFGFRLALAPLRDHETAPAAPAPAASH